MTYLLSLRKEAEFDISEAFDYYQGIRPELGHDFLKCLEEAFNKIQRNPLNYRTIFKDLRRVPIKRYPYRVFYQLKNEQIIVYGVFHARRNPTNWSERI